MIGPPTNIEQLQLGDGTAWGVEVVAPIASDPPMEATLIFDAAMTTPAYFMTYLPILLDEASKAFWYFECSWIHPLARAMAAIHRGCDQCALGNNLLSCRVVGQHTSTQQSMTWYAENDDD